MRTKLGGSCLVTVMAAASMPVPAAAVDQHSAHSYANCMLDAGAYQGNLTFTTQYVENNSNSAVAEFICPIETEIGGLEPNNLYDVTVYARGNNDDGVRSRMCFKNNYSSGSCYSTWTLLTSYSDSYLAIFPPSGSYSAATYRAFFWVELGPKYGSQKTRFYSYKIWTD